MKHVNFSGKRVVKLFVVFVPVIFFVLFWAQIAASCDYETTSQNETVVYLHDDGYKPANIAVKPGTKVVFENAGTQAHWPASDNHPSHTLYDGTTLEEHCGSNNNDSFDACGSIAQGDAWSFVFDEEGTYQFHDHLWPHLRGSVKVETTADGQCAEKHFLRSLTANLFSGPGTERLNSGNINNNFYKNLKVKFESLVKNSDPRRAIRSLEQESQQNDKVSALCHDILHDIGHAAYKKYGNFKDAVQYQSDFCNSGYIHGLFESYFASADDPLAGLSDVCSDYASGKRQFDLWQCHHGIGHGFMYLTGGDLDKSLALCGRGLGTDAADCQNGVYMEVFNLEVLAKEKDYVDSDDPFSTCSDSDIAKADCYLYVPAYLSQTAGMEYAEIFKECQKAEYEFRDYCIYGVGTEAIKRNMDDPHIVFSMCGQAGMTSYQTVCVAGVTGMYMSQEGSHAAGQKLCKKAPQNYRAVCQDTVASKEAFFK